MNKTDKQIFFLGIGGIGMSALARYYRHEGYTVAGYDRTPSDLTRALEKEGISVFYDDDPANLPFAADGLSVVWTPAVPQDTRLYQHLLSHGAHIHKRAEALGQITSLKRPLCVAGTHGKTTTSTILAHLLRQSHIGTNAFLGGISENYRTNLLLDSNSPYVVVEADEFDRSFHHLRPYMTVVTSVDPDHLDIYGTPQAYRESFEHYCSLVSDTILLKHDLQERLNISGRARVLTYSAEDSRADYYAANIIAGEGSLVFDLHHPDGVIAGLTLGVPVWVNIENSVAAAAIALMNGVTEDEIRAGLASFAGVHRRFNIHVQTPSIAYIDDYAHHPQEIAASIASVRKLYPTRHLLGIFQPHLYTRTRDFADEFAAVLSTLDEVILLPIYPARELPIPGVNSEMLLSKITLPRKQILSKEALLAEIGKRANNLSPVAVLTIGAGDIDRLVPAIAETLNS
jgi:UDP-N-acetylmuramate--alanine ligase